MERSSTIAELMERRRIQAGAKEYQGHTYMDLARFDEATKHMVVLYVIVGVLVISTCLAFAFGWEKYPLKNEKKSCRCVNS